MKEKGTAYWLAGAGLLLLAAGFLVLKAIEEPHGMMRALPYVLIGFGCGTFGHGMGKAVERRVMKNSPEAAGRGRSTPKTNATSCWRVWPRRKLLIG